MGKYSKAFSAHEKALEIRQETLPINHRDLAQSFSNIGNVYNEMGEYSKALSFYQKALKIDQQTLSANHPSLAIVHNNIGAVYDNLGEYSKALSSHEKALEIRQKKPPYRSSCVGGILHQHCGSV
jgi:tetratricopeptide (TPR) repeat protein